MSGIKPRSSGSSTSGQAKLDEVTSLMESLRTDAKENNLDPSQRSARLEQVKIHGRDPKNADPIFTKEGIQTLAQHGFDSSSLATSREALRCLANALLLQPQTRQIFVDLGYAKKAAERLKTDNRDDEFLVSRILFLLTYETDLNFEGLVEQHQLADSINENIARHAKRFPKGLQGASQPAPMDDMALSETLKLMFNITHFNPDLAGSFSPSLPFLLKILCQSEIPRPPLQPPINYLINALLNLDLDGTKSQILSTNPLFPETDPKCNAEHIINILYKAIAQYPQSELDQVITPLLTLIRRIYEIAPEDVQHYTQSLLLPSDAERNKPLGKSDTLPSRLLNLSTSAPTPALRGNISSLLFELSGKDAATFVKNVGYGFASGFLMSNNIAVPENAVEAEVGSGSADVPVNPVTGQRLDAEAPDAGPPMTEEEKEREAERLFVLFERLKKTGVIDVKNPVEQARDEGRFEELDD
ncbi:hypothetical protein W97_07234 [Coniosporium apollinis CBS 100218]|uniref:Guanine nucleotide exchange factor synembryn n=1 Tax=Coniosporium apollinis (strain CBS 100218) TaxID=1168221 RepID=R7Z2G8_CONA1|nr:uncharacterized protein W97_07234 [Coniosporium apollinis CBS 100218]EON68086.1 hypothetical protein W97_07234 [Coniosporium apollinis CBS 100218]